MFKLTCEALDGTNKTGLLKPDAEGCYEMCIGAFDVPNSRGDIYVYESAKRLFQESSLLMRRSKGEYIRGEYGHPKKQAGQSIREFVARNHEIYEDMVSHLFKEIWIDEKNIKDHNGNTIIAVMARVLPTGPYGDVLRKQFDAHENVAFSIRCFCDDKLNRNGRYDRHIRNIITWDYVNEPGLSPANKYNSPACESASIILLEEAVSMEVLHAVQEDIRRMPVTTESASLSLIVGETVRNMGRGVADTRDLNRAFRTPPKSYSW